MLYEIVQPKAIHQLLFACIYITFCSSQSDCMYNSSLVLEITL